MKLLIATPTNTTVHARFTECLFAAVKYCKEIDIDLKFIDSSFNSQSREDLVEYALTNKYDKLLFIDSDMEFPADSIKRLLHKKVGVIAVNYKARRNSFNETARIESLCATPGLATASCCGFGMFLIDLDILRYVPQPRFDRPWDKATNMYIGEDYSLCSKLRNLGCTIFIDLDLSLEIGHIGSMPLYLDN